MCPFLMTVLLCAMLLSLQITECKCNLFHQTEQIHYMVPELQVIWLCSVFCKQLGHLFALGKILLNNH